MSNYTEQCSYTVKILNLHYIKKDYSCTEKKI